MKPNWNENFDDILRSKDLEGPTESAFSFRPINRHSDLRSFEESPNRHSTPRPRLKPRLLHSPLATSSDPSNSRSVAFAMRALQDRIKELEDTQATLMRKLDLQGSDVDKAQSLWRSRLAEEVQISQERHLTTNNELATTRLRLDETTAELQARQSDIKALQAEIKQLKEALEGAQQSLKKSENQMRQQVEQVNAQLSARKDEFDRVKLGLQQAMYEKQLMLEELHQSQETTYQLQEKLEDAKELLGLKLKDSEAVRAR